MKALDLFGYTPTLLNNKQKTHKTYFGLLLTIVWIGVSAAFLLVSSQEIILKNKPKVFQTIFIDEEPSLLQLTSDNFYFAGALETSDIRYYIDESVYTLDFIQLVGVKEGSSNYEFSFNKRKAKKCSEVSTDLGDSVFSHIPKEHMYCIDPSEIIDIQGLFGNSVYKLLKIEINKCNPATSTVECKSPEEIDEVLEDGFFGFVLSDSTFNPADTEEPFSKFSGNYFTTIGTDNVKFMSLTLSKNVVETDLGVVFTDYKEEIGFSVQDYSVTTASSDTGQIAELNIFYSNKRNEYDRSYMKVQALAANISAVSKFFFILLKFATLPFAKNSFFFELVSNRRRCEEKTNLASNNEFSSNNFVKTESVNQRKRVKIPANIVWKRVICPCKLGNKPYSKCFDKMKDLMTEKQDIQFFIRLKDELDLVKTLCLTKRQQKFISAVDLNQALRFTQEEETSCVYQEYSPAKIKHEYNLLRASEEEADKNFISLLAKDFGRKFN